MILFKNSRPGQSRHWRVSKVREALSFVPLGVLVLVAGCWSQLDGLKPSSGTANGDAGGRDGGLCPSAETCGGGNCPLCGLGEACKYNSDCESRVCNGMCLPAGCSNKARDEGESDVDCGGSCDPCKDGRRCEQDPHCQSNVCEDGFCQGATCDDETKNGTESDVDCGGNDCEDCDDGKKCQGDDDCKSGFCGEGTCADPSCGDDAINGSETDLNCGGSCPDCGPGKKCEEDEDCDSQKCRANDDDVLVCQASACDDELLNGTESDQDCGGKECDPCDDGKRCLVGTDCESLVCAAVEDELRCLTATCSDERANGNETGKDCGGDTECARCPEGEACVGHADCATNSCQDDVCQAATCDDGRKNQDEVGTDCGGECSGCPTGTECSEPQDCRSGHCSSTCLPGGAGTECDDAAECLSGNCQSNHCAAGGTDTQCYENVDCLSNNCGESDRCGLSGLGQGCSTDADCVSSRCDTDAGECLASDYSIKTSAGQTNDQQITFEVWVERGASDPTRKWGDFAMMYFFTPPPKSGAYNFVAKYYGNGPDREVDDERFLAREIGDGQWTMIWRALSTNSTVIPPTPPSSSIQFQLHGQPSLNFTDTGDFSYVAGTQVENPKVVVCQRVDGRWIHTQGQAPESLDHPCELVVDVCPSDGELACDVLERTD